MKSTGPAPGDRQARHGEPGLLRSRARRGLELVERLADDQGNQLLRGGVGHPPFADQRSVAQNGDAIGDLEHLVEPMRDIDHADAARLERPQGVEQAVHLVGGKRGRRLVEDEDVGLHAQRARDRDERFFRAREVADAHGRRERAVDLGERGTRSPLSTARQSMWPRLRG